MVISNLISGQERSELIDENAIGRKIRSNAEILKQIRREGELLRSRLEIGVETDTDVKVR